MDWKPTVTEINNILADFEKWLIDENIIDKMDNDLQEKFYQLKTKSKQLIKTPIPAESSKLQRGRKKGQTGLCCKKIRYSLHEVVDGVEIHIGDFKTLGEISNYYGFSYPKTNHIAKCRHSESERIKIRKL